MQILKCIIEKIFKSIGIQVVVFSILYVIYSVFKACAVFIIKNKTDDFLELLKSVIKGAPFYHMWYLYMMVILYLLVPFIIQWKQLVSYNTFKWTAILAVIVMTLSSWTSEIRVNWGIKAFAFLGYFLIGYLIKVEVNKKNTLQAMIFILFSIIVEVGETFVAVYFAMNGIDEAGEKYSIVGPLNPVIAVASIFLFIGFSKLDIKMNLYRLAEQTFLIYLIHAGVWDVLVRIALKFNPSYSCVIIPIAVMVVALLSAILGMVCKKIWRTLDTKIHISERLIGLCFH